MSEGFEDKWRTLESEAQDTLREDILTTLVLPDSGFQFFLGVQCPEKIRTLLIRIDRRNIRNRSSIPRSKGFEIRQIILADDARRSITIQIIPCDRRYQDIFSRLAEDVLGICSGESTEKAMIKALFFRLEMWQHFMDRFGPDGLSSSEQRGLFGELRFLHDYLMPVFGPGPAVTSWIGPKRKPQDFHFAGMAVEVKTGVGGQHQTIQISGEQQLDNTGLSSLYLYHLSLKEIRSKGGETLPALIDRIRKNLQGEAEASATFDGLLFEAGYLDEHREMYSEVSYADRSAQLFLVTEGFPRIIERDLTGGVGDVRYSVTIAACAPYRIDDDTFLSTIKGCNRE